MSKKIDIEKAREILKGGFALPAEVEAFFTQAKERAVASVIKAREAGNAKLAKFNAECAALWAAKPDEEKVVRDCRFRNGAMEYFTRPMRQYEWYSSVRAKIAKTIPFFGRTDADAIRFTEEDCDAKRACFIIRTNAITGDTITASALHIDPKSGDVNGTIAGTCGTAKVQTIGAGGYNIQCYHFRCLVREVK